MSFFVGGVAVSFKGISVELGRGFKDKLFEKWKDAKLKFTLLFPTKPLSTKWWRKKTLLEPTNLFELLVLTRKDYEPLSLRQRTPLPELRIRKFELIIRSTSFIRVAVGSKSHLRNESKMKLPNSNNCGWLIVNSAFIDSRSFL